MGVGNGVGVLLQELFRLHGLAGVQIVVKGAQVGHLLGQGAGDGDELLVHCGAALQLEFQQGRGHQADQFFCVEGEQGSFLVDSADQVFLAEG